ncbi:YggT family protein [Fuchsiella alkaliacetigena]|uniref:YggT family protein n=1 Tax=Fuchsiella alkaliacetigena TaxID=957042 RepID=UPI00200AD165|nr:YggT family protein [Fuchsiella alkaliacetigena]MCK8823702.1 YggT family protein [Fuchsiella alkaliacetigena]
MHGIIQLIRFVFRIYTWILIARVISTWVSPPTHNPNVRKILRFIYQVTEPILAPLRQLLPTRGIGIDLSPIVAFILIRIIETSLIRILMGVFIY